MFDKLEAVEARYEELTKLISDPEVIANQTEWQKLIKEHSSIEEIVQKYREYKKEKQRMEDAKEMMEDKELKELAEADYYEAKENIPHIEDELKTLLSNNNYKVYTVGPKNRIIEEPDKKLKNIQTKFNKLLQQIETPPYVFAGRKKMNHISNAKAHIDCNDMICNILV